MKQIYKDIQKRVEGFIKTPFLWNTISIFGLYQFEINQKLITYDKKIDTKLRLGKFVERLVSHQFKDDKSIEIISENIQIQNNKITLGELDCLILKDKEPVHLEIIYKFYLYDATIGIDELSHFIGPNRKDSLINKLIKLKQKQLPLLYSKECVKYLESISLNNNKIEQKIYFKAQLFLPFSNKKIKLKELNSDCVVGYYINQIELNNFKDSKFHIPLKLDWLVVPHTDVKWINYNEFKLKMVSYMQRQFSPLCWIKNKNGLIDKVFLIWW